MDSNYATHQKPKNFNDKIAYCAFKMFFLFCNLTDNFQKKALILESFASIPSLIASFFDVDPSTQKALYDEYHNERYHYLVLTQIEAPSKFKRLWLLGLKASFFGIYFLLFSVNRKIAYRMTGYVEEEACFIYTRLLWKIQQANVNINIPEWAVEHWKLSTNSLLELITAIRDDELAHRNNNHNWVGK